MYGVNKKTGEKNKFPLVVVNNVYIFPGVPSLMERSFIALEVGIAMAKNVKSFETPDMNWHLSHIMMYNVVWHGYISVLFIKSLMYSWKKKLRIYPEMLVV